MMICRSILVTTLVRQNHNKIHSSVERKQNAIFNISPPWILELPGIKTVCLELVPFPPIQHIQPSPHSPPSCYTPMWPTPRRLVCLWFIPTSLHISSLNNMETPAISQPHQFTETTDSISIIATPSKISLYFPPFHSSPLSITMQPALLIFLHVCVSRPL